MAKEVSLILADKKLAAPPNAIQQGVQLGGGVRSYSVIANVKNDRVPGKSTGDICHYTYNGVSYSTYDFSYVEAQTVSLEINQPGTIPQRAIKRGFELDIGDMYSVIAISVHGSIPGKAYRSTQCEYENGREVHSTSHFYWLIA